MIDLARRISGDWIALKEKLNDLYALLDAFTVTASEMRAESERLRLAVESGIVEYKRSRLAPVLSGLETARFRTLSLEEIAGHERDLTLLLLTVLVQRLLALELIPMQKPAEVKPDFGVNGMQVNVILSDINSRIKANPSLRAKSAVKNILVQVQLYNKENRKMRELLPTIKNEMRASFLGNFTQTFNGIIESIRRNYAALLQEEAEAEKPVRPAFSLALVPLKGLAPLLTEQAKEFSRARSTLAHAREDKYKTREILVALYDSRHDAIRLIEAERKQSAGVCVEAPQFSAETCAVGIANGFRDEILGVYERQVKRDDLPA
ncbi:MAG: hypothetical protein A2177_11515 [Spirochaetes bacterium RBG_13_68_11]|nr:MAG: hypothetical protein A2177_11515 [Spirochaetes bacterium RBG_13_68_11]